MLPLFYSSLFAVLAADRAKPGAGSAAFRKAISLDGSTPSSSVGGTASVVSSTTFGSSSGGGGSSSGAPTPLLRAASMRGPAFTAGQIANMAAGAALKRQESGRIGGRMVPVEGAPPLGPSQIAAAVAQAALARQSSRNLLALAAADGAGSVISGGGGSSVSGSERRLSRAMSMRLPSGSLSSVGPNSGDNWLLAPNPTATDGSFLTSYNIAVANFAASCAGEWPSEAVCQCNSSTRGPFFDY